MAEFITAATSEDLSAVRNIAATVSLSSSLISPEPELLLSDEKVSTATFNTLFSSTALSAFWKAPPSPARLSLESNPKSLAILDFH